MPRKPKDDEQSIVSENKAPVKSVPALMGEGEKFARDQLYAKAIECYGEALDLSPGNRNALVERASCYMRIGKNNLALADAEESLKENREYTKGLFQKAEALYAIGEFELALVFYHRGKKLRTDIKEFQLGINKAQEAIDNCVGDPHSVKLEVKGDLSYFNKQEEKSSKYNAYAKPFGQKQQAAPKREKRVPKTGSQKTVKQLLGELYADKVYLEKLLEDDHATAPNTRSGNAIWGLANNGLDFLDSRTEFWRQQKPIYARKNSFQQQQGGAGGQGGGANTVDYILKQMEAIDSLQSRGKHAESLQKANKLLVFTNSKQNENAIADKTYKKAIVGHIYSYVGNAHLELGAYDAALKAHNKDLSISQEAEHKEGVSRAYENVGRVYCRNGKYEKALDAWEKKLAMPECENEEKAWLYHEIGRIHIELSNYSKAIEYGQKSLECSDQLDANNDDKEGEKASGGQKAEWQLNAVILIGQAKTKLNTVEDLESAIKEFERAIEMTEAQNNEQAGRAVRKALSDCESKLEKLRVSGPGSGSPSGSAARSRSTSRSRAQSKQQKSRSPTPEPERQQSSKKSTPPTHSANPSRKSSVASQQSTAKSRASTKHSEYSSKAGTPRREQSTLSSKSSTHSTRSHSKPTTPTSKSPSPDNTRFTLTQNAPKFTLTQNAPKFGLTRVNSNSTLSRESTRLSEK